MVSNADLARGRSLASLQPRFKRFGCQMIEETPPIFGNQEHNTPVHLFDQAWPGLTAKPWLLGTDCRQV